MSQLPTETLIDRLVDDARPVKPLPTPVQRAFVTLVFAAAIALIVIVTAGDSNGMLARYAGKEWLMIAESAAMLTTAISAIIAAFISSVPGRTKLWMVAPLPPLFLWFGLSGLGCLLGSGQVDVDHSTDCLAFITGGSLVVGLPLLWRLSKANPIEPLPVALLGGLGAAAVAAFLLQFFHPFALTPLDLGFHFGAILLVVSVAAVSRRGTLRPA